MFWLSLNKNKGFSMIEVIFAIFIITIGVVGAFSAIPRILSYTSISASRLTAAYLAQEGIEIVRNIRDTNWLEESGDWTEGLSQGEYQADYNDSELSNYADTPLKINGGFYSYDAGSDTKFKRKITLVPQGSDILEVSVRVEWQEKGGSYYIAAQDNLYNWYSSPFSP